MSRSLLLRRFFQFSIKLYRITFLNRRFHFFRGTIGAERFTITDVLPHLEERWDRFHGKGWSSPHLLQKGWSHRPKSIALLLEPTMYLSCSFPCCSSKIAGSSSLNSTNLIHYVNAFIIIFLILTLFLRKKNRLKVTILKLKKIQNRNFQFYILKTEFDDSCKFLLHITYPRALPFRPRQQCIDYSVWLTLLVTFLQFLLRILGRTDILISALFMVELKS